MKLKIQIYPAVDIILDKYLCWPVFDKPWLGSGHYIGQTWTRRKMHYDKYDYKIDSLEQSLLT